MTAVIVRVLGRPVPFILLALLIGCAQDTRDWRVLKVRGPIPLDLIGIISGISGTLAQAGISIFAFSTYDTDYVMVKQAALDLAVNVLRRAEYPIVDPIPRQAGASLPVLPVDEGSAIQISSSFEHECRPLWWIAIPPRSCEVVDRGMLNGFGEDGGREVTFAVIDTVSFEDVTEWREKSANFSATFAVP